MSECRLAADVPGVGHKTWDDLLAHGYVAKCDPGLGEQGYRLTDEGRAAWEAHTAQRKGRMTPNRT